MALAVPVRAGPREDAEAIAERAITAYQAGRLNEASTLFLEAYAISGEATQLRNAAKAKEEAERHDEALDLWQRYADHEGVSADEAAEANAHLALIREKRKTEELEATIETERRQRAQEKMVAARIVEPIVTPAPEARSAGVFPYIMVGVGVAAVAVSGVFFATSTAKLSDLDTRLDMRDSGGNVVGISKIAAQNELDAVNTQRGIAGVTLGVGIIALASGIVWAALD